MSMRQVATASLPGYGSPHYPRDEIWQLAVAFTAEGPAGFMTRTLDAMARSCPGFVTADRLLRTTDGCIWRRIIEFQVNGRGKVAVAIPMTQDWDRRDGVMLDRSPAVYIANGATLEHAKTVLLALARAMCR